MLVFTSVLVLGIFFAVFIITDTRSFKQRKVDDMISLAQVVGTNSISTLQFDDDDEARKILAELHNVAPAIIHAVILDTAGRFFASYTKPGADTLHVPPEFNESRSLFVDERLFVTHDIVDKGQVLGKVLLEVELSDLQQIKRSQFQLAFILLVAALGFAFLIAIAIQQYFSRRLVYLVNTMKEVSRTGEYNKPIADDGKDEISILINVFNDLMKQVKETQEKKDEFIGIASHELKTPLTSIKGYMELLNLMEDKESNKQFVQKAMENVRKLERLIRDLLDVSKIQSGQLELNMGHFNMDSLLDETIASFQMIANTHQIIREGDCINEVISADGQRIEQVLINLLSNAIKYSPGETQVIVHTQKTERELVIKVRDFGIGIPADEQENIFERFYRTKGTSAHFSGFGLGLYIARDIITRHNGRIWVEAQERGTAFYFSLPVKKQELQATG
ncbi:MAG TPA: ATP-binding protein [Chitinophagaceae bacterium]|nr:ATP-binding protein [Chitinophagaceae bacterium]